MHEVKKVVREQKLSLKVAQDRERAKATQLTAVEKLWNQAASLKARLRVVGNEIKVAFNRVSSMEAQIKSSSIEHMDGLREASYEVKKALADSYLDILVSQKENGSGRNLQPTVKLVFGRSWQTLIFSRRLRTTFCWHMKSLSCFLF